MLLMKLITVALISVLVIASPSVWGAAVDDRQAILGTWSGGMEGDPPGSIVLTITPTKISGRDARTGKNLGDGTYEINPGARTIDTRGTEMPIQGRTYLGIYSLEGNTLRWCSQSRGKKRPADLKHRPERDQFLMILEKQKDRSPGR
jgi:uncharacterized protein (TIGR03067 family)